MKSSWTVYIIKTSKNNLYTGITTNLSRRFCEHLATYEAKKNARGAKFFRSQKPLLVVYQESYETRSEASKREREIKQMSRAQKNCLL